MHGLDCEHALPCKYATPCGCSGSASKIVPVFIVSDQNAGNLYLEF